MNQSEKAYVRFKDAMLSGEITPGSVITQADLADKLGVRISPLRAAISKLQFEGLVDILPRSGVRLIEPDLTLIRNCFQFRSLIEKEAVRIYGQRAPDQEIDAFCTEHEELLERAKGDDSLTEGFIEDARVGDKRMHFGFVDSLNNPLVTSAYNNNVDRINLIRNVRKPHLTKDHYIRTFGEHLAILHALKDRDLDVAVAAVEEHLYQSMRREMGL